MGQPALRGGETIPITNILLDERQDISGIMYNFSLELYQIAILKLFFVYIFGAVVIMPLTGGIRLFSWVVCSLAVAVLTYGGGYSKGAFYYTIYGILLCIVTSYMLLYVGIDISYGLFEDPPPVAVWTPVIVLIFTNLGDFIVSQVFGF